METHLQTEGVKLKPLKEKSLPSLSPHAQIMNCLAETSLRTVSWAGSRQPQRGPQQSQVRGRTLQGRGKDARGIEMGSVCPPKPSPNVICIYMMSSS